MGSCKSVFRPEKMRTIKVKSLAFKEANASKQTARGGISMCKQEVENLQNCWRTSGTDSRNCLGLAASLAACVNAGYAMKKKQESALDSTGGKALEAFNAVISKFMRTK
jgi:hypothetical protein